jgi:multidrug transporter EmrE-like cation transporter
LGIVLITLGGIAVWRERLLRPQFIGIVASVIAVVFINLA